MKPELQRSSHLTTPWTTAAMAAAAGSAQAELVQINLIDNQITASGGNALFADLDGDGTMDVTFSATTYRSNVTSITPGSSTYLYNGAGLRINGGQSIYAQSSGYAGSGFNYAFTYGPNGPGTFYYYNTGPSGLIPITLGGALSGQNAWLEITRRANGPIDTFLGDPEAGVYLSRLIYDDDNTAGSPDVNTPYRLLGSTDLNGFTPADSGELVQIDLIGNRITGGGGNELFADLDGDGTNDVALTGAFIYSDLASTTSYPYHAAGVTIDGRGARGGTAGGSSTTYAFTFAYTNGPGAGPKGLMPISLSGKPGVNAWLEVERRASGSGIGQNSGDPAAGVYLTRVIYDPGNNVTPYDFASEQYTSIGFTKDGVFTAAGVEVTSFTVNGGSATISIKGAPNTAYTCKSSTSLSGFTAITPTSGSATTDECGDATFTVDATGPKRFYRIEE